ncbi:MAG: sulfur reduction protein DsrE, partial [Acidobacteria bacterium]
MKVLYIFSTPKNDAHPVEVVGMFFFLDNNYVLVKGNPIG